MDFWFTMIVDVGNGRCGVMWTLFFVCFMEIKIENAPVGSVSLTRASMTSNALRSLSGVLARAIVRPVAKPCRAPPREEQSPRTNLFSAYDWLTAPLLIPPELDVAAELGV